MNILEHAEELINEIQNRLEENERVAEESVERIHHQLEEHKNAAEEQIKRIQNQIHLQAESAGEEVRRLHDDLREHRRVIHEQIRKLGEVSEEYDRNIVEQTERIHEQIEQTKENADQQIERIREQIEQNEENAEEQIERVREQAKEFRDNSVERVKRIRERMEVLSETTENHSDRIHDETNISGKQLTEPNCVQSLIERFDEKYNEWHTAATISQTYVMNGVEILKYSGKLLPLNEMDTRYPRSEWIQTLLDKNIVIDNFHDYCRYLNARDMLMRIQKKPHVWTSGLFEIPPTEDWETYQKAYINQLTNPKKAPHA